MKWCFFNTGSNTASFNMEFDLALTRRIVGTEDVSMLRVYEWNPHAVSVGYNQSFDEFDRGKLAGAGIGLIRRPTGGRAIFHAEELTYSVAMHIGDRSLKDIYRFINEGLLYAVRSLGIEAELSAVEDRFREKYRQSAGIPCFATSAKCEIHVGGRKLIGSAQRKFGAVVLQHGSFLLGPGHRRMTEFFSPEHAHQTETTAEYLISRSIDAESILGRSVSFQEAADAVQFGFEQACSAEWVELHDEIFSSPEVTV